MKKLTKPQEEKFELMNSVSWLCLDACWMFSLKPLCFTLIFPTVITGLILFVGVKTISLKLANLGILSWSVMNIFWMCSEFFEMKSLLYLAYGCFFLGSALISYVVATNPKIKKDLIKRVSALRSFAKR